MKSNNVKKLNDNNIIYAKHSASYSAKGNALDAGNYFKATKQRSKAIIKSEYLRSCVTLRRAIDNALSIQLNHIPLNRREMIADAVCRVVISCQNTCTPNIIKNGFANTGQYVYSTQNQGFDFDAKMKCCTKPLSNNELQQMRNKFTELTELFRQQGYLPEKQLDNANIVKVCDDSVRTKDKDKRVAHQNRAFVFTDINLERFDNPTDQMKLLSKTTRKEEKLLVSEIKKKQREELKLAVKQLKDHQKNVRKQVKK